MISCTVILILAQTFVKSVLDPIPPAVPLLTMIRLTEDVVLEVQKRNCPPVEFFVFGLRLQMWPVFQKAMAEHTDALKKLAEGASGGYFSRAVATTDAGVSNVSRRPCGHRVLIYDCLGVQTIRSHIQFFCYFDRARRRNHDFLKVRLVLLCS